MMIDKVKKGEKITSSYKNSLQVTKILILEQQQKNIHTSKKSYLNQDSLQFQESLEELQNKGKKKSPFISSYDDIEIKIEKQNLLQFSIIHSI